MVWRVGGGLTCNEWSLVKPALQQGFGVHWTPCAHLNRTRLWTPDSLCQGAAAAPWGPWTGRGKGCQPAARAQQAMQPLPAPPQLGNRVRSHPSTLRQGSQSLVPTLYPLRRRGASWPVLRLRTLPAGCPGSLWAPQGGWTLGHHGVVAPSAHHHTRNLARAGGEHTLRMSQKRLRPSWNMGYTQPLPSSRVLLQPMSVPSLGPSVQPCEVGEGPRTPPHSGFTWCPQHRPLPTSILSAVPGGTITSLCG